MKNCLVFSVVLLVMVFFSSCVAKKKFLAATSHIAVLQQDSARFEAHIDDLEETIYSLKTDNQFTSDLLRNTASQLNQSQEEIEAQRKQLEHLQALINQQQQRTRMLRRKIENALTNFDASELTVSLKNGKVYVSMQESLLFPSGSAQVNKRGREALETLAIALNQNPEINVTVEGHTDSIPISKRFEDNWALSVARATSIARILINDYQVVPTRITASGRAYFDPIATNSTPEGRQKNRRTEIILEPKLDELMQLIRSAGQGE